MGQISHVVSNPHGKLEFIVGSMEVVNITATQCIHEASLQMEARMDQLHASMEDEKTPDILKKVKSKKG